MACTKCGAENAPTAKFCRGCGSPLIAAAPAAHPGEAPLLLDLPALVIAYDEAGAPSIGGSTPLSDLNALLPPALISQLTLDAALVQRATAAGIQNLMVSNTPSGLRILVNGQPLPTVVWDQQSLDNLLALLAPAADSPLAALRELVGTLTNLGIGLVVQRPSGSDTPPPMIAGGAASNAARAQADLAALREAKQRENRIRQLILAAARSATGGYNGPINGLFIRPVPGYVTSPFGYRTHPIYHYWGLHDGTDFGVSCGEPMRAIAGGTVIARYWSDVYGNRLYLSLGQINGKNVTAVYNHASSYRVGVGEEVKQGETVGYVGDTGWSTGCHLHFTILVNGTAVDPMTWLP